MTKITVFITRVQKASREPDTLVTVPSWPTTMTKSVHISVEVTESSILTGPTARELLSRATTSIFLKAVVTVSYIGYEGMIPRNITTTVMRMGQRNISAAVSLEVTHLHVLKRKTSSEAQSSLRMNNMLTRPFEIWKSRPWSSRNRFKSSIVKVQWKKSTDLAVVLPPTSGIVNKGPNLQATLATTFVGQLTTVPPSSPPTRGQTQPRNWGVKPTTKR